VELDAASNRGVDDARDLRERAMYAASGEDRFKVYIVDEAHMLTREAWNALLKVLEEPPPRVVFVFATTEPHKIAQTSAPILSRLQRFDFRRIGPHAITERLRHVLEIEHLRADDDALRLIARSADGGMRDGLSILEQVLSFGEGPVTAARVREVLGLISDDVYAELLRVVAERDEKGVFPLVDRLAEAGADLGEFVAGAGEVLRAVMLKGMGGTPEGLTETMQTLVEQYGPALPATDVVRLLNVLAETEPRLRTTGNTRLVVELLLLRWAMMDRTVELAEVLRALGKGSGERGAGGGTLRGTADGVSTTPTAPRSPLPEPGPLTAQRLRSLWPAIVAEARAKSPMLAAVLQDTEVAAVQDDTLVIRVLDQNPVHAEGLERQRDALAILVAPYVAGAVKLRVDKAAGSGERSQARPQRITEESAKGERLKTLRAKDPALNSAVDALDLELLE
jgi:DNA polymerase-3 subunit gamma/tau